MSVARARAIGVEREPGRDHGVGQPEPHPLVDQRGAVGGGDVARRSDPAVAWTRRVRGSLGRGHSWAGSAYGEGVPRNEASDRTLAVSPHRADRFPTGRVPPRLHPDRPLLRAGVGATWPGTTGCVLRRPARPRGLRPPRRVRPARSRRPARRHGRAPRVRPCVGYSMGGRLGLHLALARPDLVRGLVLIGAHGRHRRRRRAGGAAGRRRGAGRPARGDRRGRVRRRVAGAARCSRASRRVGPLRRGAPGQHRGRAGRAACATPAPVPRSRCGTGSGPSTCPCGASPGTRRRSSRAAGRTPGPPRSGPAPRRWWSPAPATPPTWSAPDARGRRRRRVPDGLPTRRTRRVSRRRRSRRASSTP